MKTKHSSNLVGAALACAFVFTATGTRAVDPSPSSNDGPANKRIVEFIGKVAEQGCPYFVPVGERIATFDNDGTLWAEQPMYSQLLFALDRVKALAPKDPEWKEKELFASLLKGDEKGAVAGGGPRLIMLVHHDVAAREWAYGAESKIGTFSDSLMAESKKNRWTVISIEHDWKRIFPFDTK